MFPGGVWVLGKNSLQTERRSQILATVHSTENFPNHPLEIGISGENGRKAKNFSEKFQEKVFHTAYLARLGY
jgi:hypothetical protein